VCKMTTKCLCLVFVFICNYDISTTFVLSRGQMLKEAMLDRKNKNNTTVLRPFVRDYPGEPAPEETLTHPPS